VRASARLTIAGLPAGTSLAEFPAQRCSANAIHALANETHTRTCPPVTRGAKGTYGIAVAVWIKLERRIDARRKKRRRRRLIFFPQASILRLDRLVRSGSLVRPGSPVRPGSQSVLVVQSGLVAVAHAWFGEQMTRPGRVVLELAAQPSHVKAQVVGALLEAGSPDASQDLCRADELTGTLQ
jgi:hypothetical protein